MFFTSSLPQNRSFWCSSHTISCLETEETKCATTSNVTATTTSGSIYLPSIWSYTSLESVSMLWVNSGQTILASTCPSSSMAPCQLRLMGYGCASAMEKSRTRKFGDRMAHCHNRPQPTDGDYSIKCIHWHNRPHTTDFSTKCLGCSEKP